MSFQSILEKLAGDNLAVEIDWIHLSFLIEAHRNYLNNLALNLGKELHIDGSVTNLCNIVKEVYEIAEEALALDVVLVIWAFFHKLFVVFIISLHDILRHIDHLDILRSSSVSMILAGFDGFVVRAINMLFDFVLRMILSALLKNLDVDLGILCGFTEIRILLVRIVSESRNDIQLNEPLHDSYD